MSPATLGVLLRIHRRVHSGKGGGSVEAEPGSTADLLAFARMQTT